MIKKGDKFECIKPVIMDGNPEDVAYTEGELYTSDFDNCITDNQGNKSHYWSDKKELTIYFKMVNHPSHYKNNKYECIDVMLDIFGKEKVLAFCELNAFKYQWRANFKGTDIQDKKKAEWYLNKYIELKEKIKDE